MKDRVFDSARDLVGASVEAVQSYIEDLWNHHPKGKSLDDFGREVPDPIPVAPPADLKPQPTLADQIREAIRAERLSRASEGIETFEESNDFDTGEDDEPMSRYELQELEGEPEPDPLPPSPSAEPPEAEGTQPEAGEVAPPADAKPSKSGSKK